jgi:hypothetical protein
MEGIVAKQLGAGYTPDATTWVKIKNRNYTQAVGRHEFFDRRKYLPKDATRVVVEHTQQKGIHGR